jgi:translation initiation factor IF-2
MPGKEVKKTEITVPRASKRVIRISEVITVAELARSMGVKAGEVLKKLIDMGMMATINQALDHDTATLVAGEFEYQVENIAFDAEQALETEQDVSADDLVVRAPVVTMMGHVDHGKTSLLDAVRVTKVAAREAGGITQHIGAYTVEVQGRQITFLDTPGHAAFTAMRARGAQVTDIVVLVVAADDGVMPQTVEAINHARAASVPIVVAINKIDKPDANVERVRQELSNHGLVPEEWGGETTAIGVSAKTGDGIEQLLEMLLLQADILELKANPARQAKGVIIEARLDRGRGPVATVLVQEGTLRVGDSFVCGVEFGRLRAMMDDKGNRVKSAGPSTPVEILGIGGVPAAGDVLLAVQEEQKARQVAGHRANKQRDADMTKTAKVSLDDLYQQVKQGSVRELKVVLKADVQGSVEAVSDALQRLSTDEVRLAVIHGSVGGITESDVLLASASNGVIIGFNVRPEPKAAALAEREGVDIRLYTIIYEALNELRDALEGLLEPTTKESTLGRAEVRETFSVSGVGLIAGCFVTEGKLLRNAAARLLRDNVVVHEGRLGSLKRFKDDAREVLAGYECGAGFEGFQDVKSGDVIEAYEMVEVTRRLQTSPRTAGAERPA